jgi:16S rRNA (adenine1518-N6/adenine1519-N6)-dimethyltransferase
VKLTDPATLKDLLGRHGFAPQKKWGQHFLISENVVGAIVSEALLDSPKGVLEVGPGPGVLTRPLSESVEKLIAFEVDPIAVSALSESAPRANVRHEDALRVDLEEVMKELPSPAVLVSNMPYNITGPLLDRFTQIRGCYTKAVLMMQAEVGNKILAQPGQREMGALSVVMQTYFEIRRLVKAPAGAFFPPPKVESVVLVLIPRPGVIDDTWYLALVRAGFSQPRKTLANNLASLVGSRDIALGAIEKCGLTESIRPHQISLTDWAKLAAAIARQH